MESWEYVIAAMKREAEQNGRDRKTVRGQIEQGMISPFCHRTKGGSTQRNHKAEAPEQTKVPLNPDFVSVLPLVLCSSVKTDYHSL